jgi:hypothetical protein
MGDTVTATNVKTASTGFTDIHTFFYKFKELEWTEYLFLEEIENFTLSGY